MRMAKLHEMGCRGLSEEGHDGRVGTRTERDCERSREKDWGREKERNDESRNVPGKNKEKRKCSLFLKVT